MRHPHRWPAIFVPVAVLSVVAVANTATAQEVAEVPDAAAAQEPIAAAPTTMVAQATREHPLEPPNTSSPRATLQTFLTEVTAGWHAFLADAEARLRQTNVDHGHRAARCFDLSQVAAAQLEDVSMETVILLFDVLNRIEIPPLEEVPDADQVMRESLTRWVIPHTSIAIGLIDSGPRAGEWLFTTDVVERAREFYEVTRHLSAREDAVVEDGFTLYIAARGWMIPVGLIDALPDWTRGIIFEQTVWQWGLLVVVLLLAGLLSWLAVRWSRRVRPEGVRSPGRRFLAAITVMMISSATLYMLDDQLNITGSVLGVFRAMLNSIYYLAAAWAVLLAGRLLADAFARRAWGEPLRMHADLFRAVTSVLTFGFVFLLAVAWARSMGIPFLGVVAGFGVGGIALALAAQSTVENFIGGLSLFADQPVRVGDLCRFGDKIGTVESIGLRSTRIRTLERSVLTVPNSQFSRLQLDNLTGRDQILFRTKLNLRLETSTDQLQRVLDGVKELFLGHDLVNDVPARIRLVAAGPHSLDLEIFAYLRTNSWNEFLGIREELLMSILSLVEAAGTALAPPARTTYLRSGEAVERRADNSSRPEAD
jgi:MscS family membrane protein